MAVIVRNVLALVAVVGFVLALVHVVGRLAYEGLDVPRTIPLALLVSVALGAAIVANWRAFAWVRSETARRAAQVGAIAIAATLFIRAGFVASIQF